MFSGKVCCAQPFQPQYQHAYSPHWPPYISYATSWEILFKTQRTSSLVIKCSIKQRHCFKGNFRLFCLDSFASKKKDGLKVFWPEIGYGIYGIS